MFQDVGVPETKDGKSLGTHEFIALAVGFAVGVLTAINLDDQSSLSATEVGEVGANRELTGEFEAAESASFQFQPERRFRLIIVLAEAPGSFRRACFATASIISTVSPHSVAASRRHLSPLRG